MDSKQIIIGSSEYKLLTIGNITKICDDKLLFNNGILSPFQWFTFQLEFLLKNLGVSIYDSITRYKLTRMQMYEYLFFVYNGNVNIDELVKTNMDEWINYGFIRKNIKNTFSLENLGGYIAFKTIINKSNSDIKTPSEKILFTYEKPKSTQKIIKEPATDYIFNLSKPEVIKKQGIKPRIKRPLNIVKSVGSSSQSADLPDVSVRSDDPCLHKGRFSWSTNSCYADSILLLLIYRILENKGSTLYNHIISLKYSTEDITGTLATCSGQSIEKSRDIYNNIIQEIQTIIRRIEAREEFNINKFRGILEQCRNMFSQQYWTDTFQDTTEFISDIFRVMNIITEESNIINEYFFSIDNNNLETIVNMPDFFYNMNIPATDLSLGRPFMSDYITTKKTTMIQNYMIKSENLQVLYNNLDIEDHTLQFNIGNKEPFMYDIILDKYIKKEERESIEIKKASVFSEIQNMLRKKEVTNAVEDESPVYHFINKDYEEITTGEGTFFLQSIHKNNPEYWRPIAELPPEMGFRLKYKVSEYVLTNETEDILINIERRIRRIKEGIARDALIDLRIIPNEYITIGDGEGNRYVLYGIVIAQHAHYISYYRCNDNYYYYNDIGHIKTKHIGNYEKMLSNNNHEALTNSKILYYIKV